MKLHAIRLCNLNALMGEWAIDLTHPAIVNDGIFAIVGPTGSGKTTLLDAVCLALYGRTPRLSKVTKSGNDIMSRPAGDCFAEVVFSTQKGTYRCHWSHHRARRKADGEWQSPKHEIACAITGQLLDTSLKGVPEQVALVTGMDFDRFTRSMLLAQGGFDAFLKADTDQRAPILEQITGSECYSQISMQVHGQLQLEKQALQTLQQDTHHLTLLSPEATDALRVAIQTHFEAKTHAQTQLEQARHALAWHDTLHQLTHEASQLELEAAQLATDRLAFAADQVIRERALAAHAVTPVYGALQQTITQQADDLSTLTKEKEALARARSEMASGQAAVTQAQATLAQHHAEWAAREPVWQQVTALDTQLATLTATIEAQQTLRRQAEHELESTRQRLMAHREALQACEQTGKALAEWREAHAADQAVADAWPRLQDQMAWWHTMQQTIQMKQTQWQAAMQAVDEATEQVARRQAEWARYQHEWEVSQGAHHAAMAAQKAVLGDRDLVSYRDEKAQRDAAHRQAQLVATLQTHRAQLTPGTPCPLCGATTHPWGMGHPIPDADDEALAAVGAIISQAEALATTIRDCETVLQMAHTHRLQAEHQVSVAQVQQAGAQRHADTVAADLARDREAVAAWWARTSWWQGPAPDTAVEMAEAWQQLTDRVGRWHANQADEGQHVAQRAHYLALIQQNLATEAAQTQAIAALCSPLTEWQATHRRLSDERVARGGTQRVDAMQQGVKRAIEVATEALQQVQSQWQTLVQRVDMAQGRVDGLAAQWQDRAVACEAQRVAWHRECVRAGFEDEADYLGAIRPMAVIEQLTQQAKALDDRGVIVASKTQACQARLATEQARAVTEASRDDTQASVEAWQVTMQTQWTQWEVLSQQLAANEAATQQMVALRHRIEAQQKEWQRWAQLHELIGSADGKKYRLFAQGITFDVLIAHANHHLGAITDRYLLVRDHTTPLALNVVDHYQGGSIRSTKNLSGGESFMVSLALALGLSHMASQNVRVDSLFLDEGFGTLDDEALHTAIDTLSSLYQGGKMIGVISHVPALKERIRTQIQVMPIANGCSRLSGPGVSGGPPHTKKPPHDLGI